MSQPLHIIIFGAGGRIGKLLTQQALDDGYYITGFVQDRQSLAGISHERLHIYEGDATQRADVNTALPGHDVVISVLGHSRHTPVEMQSDAMRVITHAMQEHKIKRIVSLTGVGVFNAMDSPTILDRFFVSVLMFLQPKRIQDGIKHVQVLKDGDRDWVVLRTPKHRSARATSNYQIQPTIKGVSFTVHRRNITEELLRQATLPEIIDRYPVISDR